MREYSSGKEFIRTIESIKLGIADYNPKTYFANKEIIENQNVFSLIAQGKASQKGAGFGDPRGSDMLKIFSTAIEESSHGKLGIVLSDCIYSIDSKSLKVVDMRIESAFTKSLKKSKVETVIIKIISGHSGKYWSETKKPKPGKVKGPKQRPFYLVLFGEKEIIDFALANIIDDIEEYVMENARFFIAKPDRIPYGVLARGEEMQCKYQLSPRGRKDAKLITNLEKEEDRKTKEKKAVQFAIAFDMKDLSLPESYIMDTLNYRTTGSASYRVIDVKKIDELSPKSMTFSEVKGGTYSHIIIVKEDGDQSNLFGTQSISLMIKIPEWINKTGSDDDSNPSSSSTYAFDRLLQGVSDAYEGVKDRDDYFKLDINIKIDD